MASRAPLVGRPQLALGQDPIVLGLGNGAAPRLTLDLGERASSATRAAPSIRKGREREFHLRIPERFPTPRGAGARPNGLKKTAT